MLIDLNLLFRRGYRCNLLPFAKSSHRSGLCLHYHQTSDDHRILGQVSNLQDEVDHHLRSKWDRLGRHELFLPPREVEVVASTASF